MTPDYQVNSSKLKHATIDDEVVIIDLQSGKYHLLQHSGADIWGMLEQSRPTGEIVDVLLTRYHGDAHVVAAEVSAFLQTLHDETLISPLPSTGELTTSPASRTAGDMSRPAFVPPVVETYVDLQDLLLLDPIHDVDDMGWPYPQDR